MIVRSNEKEYENAPTIIKTESDENNCAKTSEYTRLGFETAMVVVEDADTIIEADKESKI